MLGFLRRYTSISASFAPSSSLGTVRWETKFAKAEDLEPGQFIAIKGTKYKVFFCAYNIFNSVCVGETTVGHFSPSSFSNIWSCCGEWAHWYGKVSVLLRLFDCNMHILFRGRVQRKDVKLRIVRSQKFQLWDEVNLIMIFCTTLLFV